MIDGRVKARRWDLHWWRYRNAADLGSRGARTCRRAFGDEVITQVDRSGTLHTGGVERCGSVASCPLCAPMIRSQRAKDIDRAVEWWIAHGGDVWFMTATIPHCAPGCDRDHVHGETRLRTLLRDQLAPMWSKLWREGKAAQKLKEAVGYQARIDSFEVTYSERSGWHPHVHSLVFTLPGTMDVPKVARRWRSMFEREGFGERYVPHVSIDVKRWNHSFEGDEQGEGSVGDYVAGHSTWGAGLELARSDLKRSGGGVAAAQVLELAASGDRRWRARWIEYEQATKGFRWFRWTTGLRAQVGLDVEATDVDAAAGPEATDVIATVYTPSEVYEWARQRGRLHEFYVDVITGQAEERWSSWMVRGRVLERAGP